ncbi:MAG: NifU family protein, partial [Candidatus Eremiobacteraeota bacterium]|nr:NifU family protein [Candidatus Eremiobacteraeota bacterium]
MGRCRRHGRSHAQAHGTVRTINSTVTQTIAQRVNEALAIVRPGLLRDGGDAWLIKVENNIAYLQMVGA